MRDVTKQPKTYKRFEFGEEEFKQLLGIDWPGGVLDVSVNFSRKTVTITMSVGVGQDGSPVKEQQ